MRFSVSVLLSHPLHRQLPRFADLSCVKKYNCFAALFEKADQARIDEVLLTTISQVFLQIVLFLVACYVPFAEPESYG